jgi:hypothetical protein
MKVNAQSLSKFPRLSAKLLPRFIARKLSEYVPPTKKGTPKGEPVGFPPEKYRATLYALREKVLSGHDDIQAQAKVLKVAYGVLRTWRSEQVFKDLVSQHEREFVVYVLRAMRHREAVRGTELELARSKTLLETARSLLRYELESVKSPAKTDEAKTRLILSTQRQALDALKNSATTTADVTAYHKLLLEYATRILEDSRRALKHRQDVADLLSRVRETLR